MSAQGEETTPRCPGCLTARLTFGRTLCQACTVVRILGRPPLAGGAG